MLPQMAQQPRIVKYNSTSPPEEVYFNDPLYIPLGSLLPGFVAEQ